MQLVGENTPKRIAARVIIAQLKKAMTMSSDEISDLLGDAVNDAQAGKIQKSVMQQTASYQKRLERLIS